MTMSPSDPPIRRVVPAGPRPPGLRLQLVPEPFDRDVRGRAPDVAGRARIRPEVADAAPGIRQLPTASVTGHRISDRTDIRRLLLPVRRHRVEAERAGRKRRRRCDHRQSRVVDVVHETAAGGCRREGGHPAVHDGVRLAEPIQLIAKDVGRNDDGWRESGEDLLERRLVDLEHGRRPIVGVVAEATAEVRLADE